MQGGGGYSVFCNTDLRSTDEDAAAATPQQPPLTSPTQVMPFLEILKAGMAGNQAARVGLEHGDTMHAKPAPEPVHVAAQDTGRAKVSGSQYIRFDVLPLVMIEEVDHDMADGEAEVVDIDEQVDHADNDAEMKADDEEEIPPVPLQAQTQKTGKAKKVKAQPVIVVETSFDHEPIEVSQASSPAGAHVLAGAVGKAMDVDAVDVSVNDAPDEEEATAPKSKSKRRGRPS